MVPLLLALLAARIGESGCGPDSRKARVTAKTPAEPQDKQLKRAWTLALQLPALGEINPSSVRHQTTCIQNLDRLGFLTVPLERESHIG